MKNNDSSSFWFHIPILLIKIVRILTKKPSGEPKTIHLELWGRLIQVSTEPVLSIENKKTTIEDYQPRLDLGEADTPSENKELPS